MPSSSFLEDAALLPSYEDVAESNCDRLSEMPDEILHHILSFLPTRESVRTSVLSQWWRHLWRCVPTFHSDVKVHPNQLDVYGSVAVACKQPEKINKFSIDTWIRCARSHGAHNMTVHISSMRKMSSFSIFFDLPSIEVLDLGCLSFAVPWTPSQRVDVSKLKVLSLLVNEVSISCQSLTSLLSYCPALQELTVHHGQCSQDLDITAPNLRPLTSIDSLYFSYCDSYHSRIICPMLEHLHLTIRAHLKQFKGHLPSPGCISLEEKKYRRVSFFSHRQ